VDLILKSDRYEVLGRTDQMTPIVQAVFFSKGLKNDRRLKESAINIG
jgi:hypothetical protein